MRARRQRDRTRDSRTRNMVPKHAKSPITNSTVTNSTCMRAAAQDDMHSMPPLRKLVTKLIPPASPLYIMTRIVAQCRRRHHRHGGRRISTEIAGLGALIVKYGNPYDTTLMFVADPYLDAARSNADGTDTGDRIFDRSMGGLAG